MLEEDKIWLPYVSGNLSSQVIFHAIIHRDHTAPGTRASLGRVRLWSSEAVFPVGKVV